MIIKFTNPRFIITCLAVSLCTHVAFLYLVRMCGSIQFAVPVNLPPPLIAELSQQSETNIRPVSRHRRATYSQNEPNKSPRGPAENPEPAAHIEDNSQNALAESTAVPELPTEAEFSTDSLPATLHENNSTTTVTNEHRSPIASGIRLKAGDFLTAQHEKLTYLVSMLGIPVGSAELESKYKDGEVWITLRVKSNAAISSLYPVDDIVESRHIDGRFIMSSIKQHEGSFKSDEGFTVNLIKKRVSWFDNMHNRSLTTYIPSDQVLDTLSGIYYLRNRQLHIGKTETLHIFDSEVYAEVPVEILRQETVRLPNLTHVDTLVIKPLQKTKGIFRRTGDILIWITDDEFKVPVKIVTSVTLGTITVELVSSEATPLIQSTSPPD
ncbi:MAG: DUF3108 domain-containing protein [Desulfuromonadaceae bacterium]|nr:DUF3108 domain-containing protein [Desulfuromonadaceae bacterium]